LENRIKVANDGETAAQERTKALEKEVADAVLRLQKTVEQLNHAAQSTIEKFDSHVTAQLNSWSAQFKSHLEAVSRDKATQFTAELQQQSMSCRQEVNEILEKLAAGLQLAQGTARMQEERLAGFSRDAAANFEAEIKAVLLRLAGPV
jgi:ABC-type transporter Mla subunit MlaD